MSSMADALFPAVRQRVLAVLFGAPARSFYANEVIARARSGTGALASLLAAGLITVREQGNQKHYQANAASPIFSELRGLVLKTVGLADVLRAALEPLAGQLAAAFVYGSVARKEDTAQSDVDVLIVSDSASYAEVFNALEGAAQTLGRRINPTLYTRAELTRRLAQDQAFITRVLQQPRIWLLGDEALLAHGS
ncbi:MAG TPA: nucleotidyltransferase domain-containing protein [Ottowia sp.]|nr:nucleotidyltransferase domain-containing protein [Ottowia sp.]